jgi:hypothetical protein
VPQAVAVVVAVVVVWWCSGRAVRCCICRVCVATSVLCCVVLYVIGFFSLTLSFECGMIVVCGVLRCESAGSNPKMLAKRTSLRVDSVCLDLEDAVSPNAKHTARSNIVAALNALPPTPCATEQLVRINPVGSGLETEDVSTVCGGLCCVR